MCEKCDDLGYIDDVCKLCAGTGEGQGDGSFCDICNGRGIEYVTCDCEYGKDFEILKEDDCIDYVEYGSF